MLLTNKNALVFAAGGAIGSAVARRLAAEGARVYLSGRSAASVQALAEELDVPWACVDATNEEEVRTWVDGVAAQTGGIDVVFNAIGPRAADGDYAALSTAIPYDRFLLPLTLIAGSQFLSARTAVRHMQPRGRGTIVFLSASLTGQYIPFMSGITAACGAVEALSRTLAAEFGPSGLRVNCVRAGGMPETRTIQETNDRMSRTISAIRGGGALRPASGNLLMRPLRIEETAAAVAWLASDQASGVTGQVMNVCGGAVMSR